MGTTTAVATRAESEGNPVARIHRCGKHPDKVQYRTIEDAFETAERRQRSEGYPIHVYACDHCGYFHLSKKAGTENLGHELLTRADGVIWTSQTPPGVPVPRDERFENATARDQERLTAEATQLRRAISDQGNPVSVTTSEIIRRTGRSRFWVYRVMEQNGWVLVGTRAAAKWFHPDHVPAGAVLDRSRGLPQDPPVAPAPEPAPPVRSKPTPAVAAETNGWETLTLAAGMETMTIRELIAAYHAIGIKAEIRIRRPR